jgi:hypothetical protein
MLVQATGGDDHPAIAGIAHIASLQTIFCMLDEWSRPDPTVRAACPDIF